MKILSKYILKEHIGPFVFSLLTIIFIFLINTIFRDLGKLLNKGVSIGIILQFFALNLAWIVALAVPMSVLIATLMAFGRFSSDHELTALKASGLHFYRLVTPVILAALLLTVGMERFNNLVLPEVNHLYSNLSKDIRSKNPTIILEPQVFNDIESHSLWANEIDTERNVLKSIIINDYSDKNALKTILADSGKVVYSEADECMILTLFNGEMHEADIKEPANYRRGSFKKMMHYIRVGNVNLKRRDRKRRGLREKNSAMMNEDLKHKNESIAEHSERICTIAQNDWQSLLPAGIWSASNDSAYTLSRVAHPIVHARRMQSQIKSQLSVIKSNKKSISSLKVEIHKKYAIPVACLVFVLIGAPLGFMARQSGVAAGGVLSLIFFLIYWFFLIGGEALADRMLLHPILSMWLANIVVGGGGVYLMVRSVREASFIDWERIASFFNKFRRFKI
ncbi:LptF/LptG family permease [bacterium]|nr:LptF/LptG family permease [bacterium]